MYPFRHLIVSFSVLLLGAGALFAQVAVERAPNPEEAAAEAEAEAEPAKEEAPSDEATPKAKAKAQAEKPRAKSIEMMSPEEFKAAGLDKLSPEELKNLDAVLKGQRRAVETRAAQKATEKARVEAKVEAEKVAKAKPRSITRVESRVDGTITRLTGRSIIRLEDGSQWKQADPEDRFPAQVVDRPSAMVFRTGFGWKMRIAGMPEFYVDPYGDN